ncbi:RNA polymerase sigma factor [Streptomyces sp. XD-27]|uniref:RNA polymerase sigma factor n=1 Tax=Streptomyces sp. XD-27 TaxID=3062779 RepID=UPI0026F433BF|nr:RNA polymerase sigma factor [Streptomyces sp. XD-27]WKX72158.1 RNA polymerase sigma factor [Streptomyces sp. XD-27]
MSQTQPEATAPTPRSEEGPQEEMRVFYIMNHPRLIRFVTRRVGLRKDAEDVCQDIWRMFFVKYDEFAAHKEPTRMLYRIAQCRIADFWRRRGNIQEDLMTADVLDASIGGTPWAVQFTEGVERRLDVSRAVAALPPRQREALLLHHVDALTVCETAGLMGISENTVKKLLKNALSALRTTTPLDGYGATMTRREERR